MFQRDLCDIIFNKTFPFVSNIFTIVFERVTRIFPIDSSDTRCTRVTIANKTLKIKSEGVANAHVREFLCSKRETRDEKKDRG